MYYSCIMSNLDSVTLRKEARNTTESTNCNLNVKLSNYCLFARIWGVYIINKNDVFDIVYKEIWDKNTAHFSDKTLEKISHKCNLLKWKVIYSSFVNPKKLFWWLRFQNWTNIEMLLKSMISSIFCIQGKLLMNKITIQFGKG